MSTGSHPDSVVPGAPERPYQNCTPILVFSVVTLKRFLFSGHLNLEEYFQSQLTLPRADG